MFRTLIPVLGALALIACGAAKDGGTPVEQTVEVKRMFDKPPAKATLKLGEGWRTDDFWKDQHLLTKDPFQASIRFSASCGGVCEADKIPANVDREIQEALDAAADKDNDKPHFRGTVQVHGQGTLGSNKYVAYTVTYPEPPSSMAMRPMPGTHFKCFAHTPGDEIYVGFDGKARPEFAKAIWPGLKTACETLTYTK